MSNIQLELNQTLASLKDFQRATVNHVMSLFDQPGHKQRVLIADEVGLGKTIVAKGIIASLLKKQPKNSLLRVTYICSNLALAAENQSKLAIFKGAAQQALVKEPSFGRLAELGLKESTEEFGKILEICTLTPATSFSLTHGLGNKRERAIIFKALVAHPKLSGYYSYFSQLFKNDIYEASWNEELEWVKSRIWNEVILNDFHQQLTHSSGQQGAAVPMSWLDFFRQSAKNKKILTDLKNTILREMRILFVKCCAANLSADLFILDEFQRFKTLIDAGEENEQTLIAQQVFSKADNRRVLLLSATPFKAMTTIDEDETDEAHQVEMGKILSFLNMNASLATYELGRANLHAELLKLKQNGITVASLSEKPRKVIETELRPLISRTERVQIAEQVNEVFHAEDVPCTEQFSSSDIEAFRAVDQIAFYFKEFTQARTQLLEFYKSAPWPLSFCNGYKLKTDLHRYAQPRTALHRHLNKAKGYLFVPYESLNNYQLNIAQDAPNAKMRFLCHHLFGNEQVAGPEMLLWLPPSMPHYALGGIFKTHAQFSKTLIFSAWAMVPRMMSSLLSYEAERRIRQTMLRSARLYNYFDQSSHNPLLHFDGKNTLASWALVYPAKVLININLGYSETNLETLLRQRTVYFHKLLMDLKEFETETRIKADNWYAMAPLLLDQRLHPHWLQDWLNEQIRIGLNLELEGRVKKLDSIKTLLATSNLALGKMPDDLAEFLALLSIASPAVCSARALEIAIGDNKIERDKLSDYSTKIAFAFSELFNSIEGSQVIRRYAALKKTTSQKKTMVQKSKGPQPGMFKQVLRYCAEGGLQAMLEEYIYMLKSANKSYSSLVETICTTTGTTLSTSSLAVQHGLNKNMNLRCHYAMALGHQKMESEKGLKRVKNTRETFNSPFRPFVLTSTSIGQEGLDFHWYCSEVVHWNLPANPIDLEQREGRVNRFQSLIVRRRAVKQFFGNLTSNFDWDTLFKTAAASMKILPNHTDLTPYWHIPAHHQEFVESNLKIRRIVPMLPLSREVTRYNQILKILSLYRLTFGQPRQEELLEHLLKLNLSDEDQKELKQKLIINLAPICFESHSLSKKFQNFS